MENMYVAQNNVVEQLKQECHSQADIIENLSTKYRKVLCGNTPAICP